MYNRNNDYDNNNFRHNKSTGYFSQIGNQLTSPMKMNYNNPNDMHYYNNRGGPPRSSSNFNQNNSSFLPKINQQPQRPTHTSYININFQAMPQQQMPIQPQHRDRDLEDMNAILRWKLENMNPQRDILSYIENRLARPQYVVQQPQQPIIIIDSKERYRDPPREQIIYQQQPNYIMEDKKRELTSDSEDEPKKRKRKKKKKKKKEPEPSDTVSVQESEQLSEFSYGRRKKGPEEQAPPPKESTVLIKVLGLENHNRLSQNFIVQHQIVNDTDIFLDLDKKPCNIQDKLQTLNQDPRMIEFDYNHEYKIDYEELGLQMEDEEQLLLMIAIYENSPSPNNLVGWVLQPLFRPIPGSPHFEVNKGRYIQNMYEPPMHNRPFVRSRKIMDKVLDYVIVEGERKHMEVPEQDQTEDVVQDDGELIIIEMKKLHNHPYNGKMRYEVQVDDGENPIDDRNQVKCFEEGIVNYTKDRNTSTIKHETTYQISQNYLRSVIDPLSRKTHSVTIKIFDEKEKPIGSVYIPLFKGEDIKEINKGYHTVPVEEFNGNPTMEVRIMQDKPPQINIEDYDPNKGLLVMIFKINNYREKEEVGMHIEIVKGTQTIDDMDENPVEYDAQDTFEPDRAKKVMHIKEGIELAVNWKLIRDLFQSKESHLSELGILFKFFYIDDEAIDGNEPICGWTIHKMFQGKLLNKGKFYSIPLYKGPLVKQFPVNQNYVEESGMTIDFQIGTCRLDDSFVGEAGSSGDSFSEHSDMNLENFIVEVSYLDDVDNQLGNAELGAGVRVYNGTNLVNDDEKNKPIDLKMKGTAQVQGNKYTVQEKFQVELSIQDIEDKGLPLHNYYIVVYFYKRSKPVAWCYQPLLQGGRLKTGLFTKSVNIGNIEPGKFNKPEKLNKSKARIGFSVTHEQI